MREVRAIVHCFPAFRWVSAGIDNSYRINPFRVTRAQPCWREGLLALDRGNRLGVFPKRIPNPCHARTRYVDARISRKKSVGSLKGKDSLTRGFGCDRLLQPF